MVGNRIQTLITWGAVMRIIGCIRTEVSRSSVVTAQSLDMTTEGNVDPVSTAFARLEGVIDQKITTLKRDLAAENEESLSRIAKRFKSGNKHEFKRQGNEEQFDHQREVKDALQNAFDALVSSKYEEAKVALEEGI